MVRFAEIVLCLCFTYSALGQNDPCDDYQLVVDMEGLLSAGTEAKEPYTCHRPLQPGWRRFDSPAGNDIPTTCVEIERCNTINPVWINGTLPPADGEMHTVQSLATRYPCGMPGATRPSAPIHVKNCTTYNVYFLTEVPFCDSAYCVGRESRCPNGTNSETGFTPGCSANIPDTPPTPVLNTRIHKYRTGPGNQFETHEFQMLCSSPGAPDEQGISYDVEWYGTNKTTPTHHDVLFRTVRSSQLPNILNDTMLPKGLNVDVWCRIRTRSSMSQAPSRYTNGSNKYFVGAEIQPKAMVLYPGESSQVNVTLTAPLLCKYGPCTAGLELYMLNNRKPMCSNETNLGGFTRSSCFERIKGIRVGSEERQQTKTFTVEAAQTSVYTRRSYVVYANFKIQEDNSHRMWNNYHPPPLHVTILDEYRGPSDRPPIDLNSMECGVYTDPNFKTFDRCYYDMQVPGEFVFYRHRFLTTQVNIFTRHCHSGATATCTCAVAIRSGRTHYIYDQCWTPIRDDLLACEDNKLSFSQERSGSDLKIELLLSGTVVTLRHRSNHVRVYIKPSKKDVGVAEGLCGNPNGDHGDDMRIRASPPANDTFINCKGIITLDQKRQFGRSWRVTNQTDSLFNKNLPTVIQGDNICGCSCDDNNRECRSDLIVCDDEVKTICDQSYLPLRRYINRCQMRINQKRSTGKAEHDYSDLSRPSFKADPDTHIQEPTWRGGWNETTARAACRDAIYNGAPGTACASVPGLDFDSFVTSCMNDIKIMGSAEFLRPIVDALRGSCRSQLSGNFSLWTAPSNETEPTPPTEITDSLCPGECSGNGTCIGGECSCQEGYGDVDCSVNLRIPPVLRSIPGNCDLSRRPCQATPVYGGVFLDSGNLACRVQSVELTTDGSRGKGSPELLQAEYVHREEIMCPLPELKTLSKREAREVITVGHGYTIQVSNDGSKFSSPINLLSFDTTCVQCSANGTDCSLKPNTCMIERECNLNGQIRSGSPCQHCNPNINRTSWIHFQGCMINNQCFLDNATNPSVDCLICDSSRQNKDWVVKDNFCFIDNQCYQHGENHPTAPCTRCDSGREQTRWMEYDCSGTSPTDGIPPRSTKVPAIRRPSNLLPIALGTVFGAIALAVVVLGLVACVSLQKKRSKISPAEDRNMQVLATPSQNQTSQKKTSTNTSHQ